jgi:hypothetical protein
MFTRQLTRTFQVTIAAGALGALFAAAPAQAFDQDAWFQEQLAISDGGSSSVAFAPGAGNTGSTYETHIQTAWLQAQLAITDGSSPYIRGDAEPVYAGTPSAGSNAMLDRQFALVEHGLHVTDGSNL